MWIGDSPYQHPDKLPLFFQRLRDMGINTAMVFDDGNPSIPVQNHFPYYVENIVNRGLCLKWSSHVTNWDAFVTQWRKDGSPASALIRDYCLDDPSWHAWAESEVRHVVIKNRSHHPAAYDLRDELSTTYSANPFDYDFNPITLAHFRQWLQTNYSSLDALNAEWQTRFASWNDVHPFTTDEIKNRMASGDPLPAGQPDWQALEALKFDPAAARQSPTRWNFAPWADFRTYMDISLAQALSDLRQTAHALDPYTPVGIEGAQMPDAFGGYDLSRLARVLDWMEPYDIGGSREILRSFMPRRNLLTTVFESDTDHARRRLWHLLLEGDRGCIIWWSEDCVDFASSDFSLTKKASALAPVLREMTSPLARLFLRATPERDPVYLLYSQPSIQVDWLLESTVDGSTWLRRFSSFEASHNQMIRDRDGWLKALQDAGFDPQFLSTSDLEAGRFADSGAAALILPDCYALSTQSLSALAAFARPGARQLFWDIPPGLFDEHGKLRSAAVTVNDPFSAPSSQPAVYCRAGKEIVSAPGSLVDYPAARLSKQNDPGWADWLRARLQSLRPDFGIPANARVRVFRYRAPNGTDRLLAFERNIEYQMSENLAQAGGNELLEKPVELDIHLPAPAHIHNLQTAEYLGFVDHFHVTLQPWQPSLFATTVHRVSSDNLVETLNGP